MTINLPTIVLVVIGIIVLIVIGPALGVIAFIAVGVLLVLLFLDKAFQGTAIDQVIAKIVNFFK